MAALVHHLWSYINGRFNSRCYGFNCPCAGGTTPPSFIGNDYYCESGTADTHSISSCYFDDPLWDGTGCITSRCCDNITLPWFYRQLNGTTTSAIEARVYLLRESNKMM